MDFLSSIISAIAQDFVYWEQTNNALSGVYCPYLIVTGEFTR